MATTQQHISQAQLDFDKALNHLKAEFSRLQTGRATPALIEEIKVEAYGSMQAIKGLGAISVPDPKTLQVQAWDRSLLGAIERAIKAANIGLNPVNDGVVVRVPMPPLTEERRKDLVKVIHQMAENAKITIRTSRGSAHSAFKTLEEGEEITEDDRRLAEKHLQEKVDVANKQVEELTKAKEKDVMTI